MVNNKRWDIRPFLNWVHDEFLPSAKVGPGPADYGQAPYAKRPALYGTADAACILYTLEKLDTSDPSVRKAWLGALASYQDPRSGFFVDDTASLPKAHNTGFAVAAMNLFDEHLTQGLLPNHLFTFADLVRDTDHAELFANSLDWRSNSYESSEILTGLASTFHNVAGVVPSGWFTWLVKHTEKTWLSPDNGMVGLDKPKAGDRDQIGGTFHFDFLWASMGKTLPHSEARAQSLLGLQQDNGLWDQNNPWWLTFDAVYMLGRALPHLPATTADNVRTSIERAVTTLATRADDKHARERDFEHAWLGVHMLTGAVSFFAYAQQLLGAETMITEQPLRLVLDRRPYI